jgi:hypothetical protein
MNTRRIQLVEKEEQRPESLISDSSPLSAESSEFAEEAGRITTTLSGSIRSNAGSPEVRNLRHRSHETWDAIEH